MGHLGDETSVLEEGPLVWAVDDDSDILDVLQRIMEEAGYRFQSFVDGRGILDALDDPGAEQPAALLLDWMLPEYTGHELLKRLRHHPRWAQQPVIVLTALPSESVLINAFEAGAVDLIRKPFAVAELMARLRWRIGERDALLSMRQRSDDSNMLLRLSRALNQSVQIEEHLELFAHTVCEDLACHACHFYVQDEERGELLSLSEGEPLALYRSHGALDALAAREHFVLSGHELAAMNVGADLTDEGLLVPMVHGERLAGAFLILGAQSIFGRERVLSTIKIAVEIVSSAIERGRLLERLRHRHQEVRENKRTLARTRDYLASVIEASPDAIVATTSHGEIVLFNGAAERILQMKREDAIGQDVRMLYRPGGAEAIMKQMRQETGGGVGRLTTRAEHLVDSSGEAIPVNITAAILYEEDGREIGSVGVFTDLRHRLLIEERLERATQDLEASKERAMMAELAGATAHELNQPLTSILNYADLLARMEALDAKATRAASVIVREAESIAEIVRQLGTITKYRTRDYVGGARIVDIDARDEEE